MFNIPHDTVLAAISAVGTVAVTAATVMQLRRNLMMLQQNSYRRERYMRWLRASGDTTSMPSLLSLIILLAAPNGLRSHVLPYIVLAAMIVFGIARTVKLARAKYKKPLVMTGRARRLFVTQLALYALIIAIITGVTVYRGDAVGDIIYISAFAAMLGYCASHILTILALRVLAPVESHINKKFYRQAQERLQSMPDLKIIGITGSYGKTSTKHYLQRIVSEQYNTLMTPGSYNTTLGVVRTVNELLKPYNEVFIVEMGAKQIGDIREICDLVHPTIGIVTAVGPQHLETFGNIDNVCRTKFELVDSLPADGLAVINNDFAPIASRAVNNCRTIRYGVSHHEGCQAVAEDISYTPQGTLFTVRMAGRTLRLTTSLMGEHNISDLTAAIAVAMNLGIPDEKIEYAVSQIKPVEHRLSRRRLPSGLTIIDDAFNSNPSGSRMALDVLAMMQTGRRIVITPGMIELGEQQYELNKLLGAHAAVCADSVLIIGEYNRAAIAEGLTEGGMAETSIRHFNTFNEAFTWVMANHKPGDTVLIENDLPDTFK